MKYVVDIKGEIEGDYEIIGKYEARPQGEWIRVDRDKVKCNKCEVIHYIAQYPISAKINYCPNCGTRMKQS